MSGVAGRSGRKTFVPSPEQRNNVKILTGLGIPQEQICLLVINPQTGKSLHEKSLRKHFDREITTGKIELHARISNFIVASIFGVTPPAGTVAIDNQHVRGMLAMFFAKKPGWDGKKLSCTALTTTPRFRPTLRIRTRQGRETSI